MAVGPLVVELDDGQVRREKCTLRRIRAPTPGCS